MSMPLPAPHLPFDQFRARVLSLYEPPLRARATRLKMRQALDSFSRLPGVRSAADLTTANVARWVVARGPGANPNTTRSMLRHLKTASFLAAEEGWVERAPSWKRLMPRRAPAARKRHHAHAQVVALLAHLGAAATDWKGRRLHALAALVAYTGLRSGEAHRGQRGDLDLEAGLFWVSARHRLKTECSAAPVPVPPELAVVLAAWLPHAGPVWLFPGVTGRGPWWGGAPGYRSADALKAAGEAVGIEGLTWHSLRHTLAKLYVARFGGSAEQARSLLRHGDVRTTEEHYLHRDDADGLRAIAGRISFRLADG